MRVGFIGTGSMGSILIESFIASKALHPSQITASNRTQAKVVSLSEKYPGLHAAESNIQTVENSHLLFLCIKPLEFKSVIDEIAPFLKEDQIVISITSPVQLEYLEKQLPCKVAKVIPSITNWVGSGASLVMFGNRCLDEDRILMKSLFSEISKPLEISEAHIRVSSDIVSCGPAFISYLLQRFITAAVQETGISREEATFLTTEMIVGLSDLLSKGAFDLETLQKRVLVPGGVTGAGLLALENIGDVFNQLFQNTHSKYRTDLDEIEQMFYGKK